MPTAIAYGAVFAAALVVPWPIFPLLLALLAGLAYRELAGLYRESELAPAPLFGALLAGAFVLAHYVWWGQVIPISIGLAYALAFALAAGYLIARWVLPQVRTVLASIAFTYLGAAYVGWLLGFLVDLWIAGSAFTPLPWELHAWLMLALLPTWAADIASYAVGSTMGKRRLAPCISPGKTWEGTLAGFGAAALMALVVGSAAGLPMAAVVFVAAAIGPVGLAGDLIESALKRRVGAKDSGSGLPGHGGVFDRIDSLITAAPLVAMVFHVTAGLG